MDGRIQELQETIEKGKMQERRWGGKWNEREAEMD